MHFFPRSVHDRLKRTATGLGLARLQLRIGLGQEVADLLETLQREVEALRRQLRRTPVEVLRNRHTRPVRRTAVATLTVPVS